MSTDDGLPRDTLDGDARRSAVAQFVDSLKHRSRGTAGETALPEQLEVTARRVDRDDDLAARFTQGATSLGGNVHSATIGDWLNVVARLLEAHRAASVAIPQVGDGFFDAERVEQLRQRLLAGGLTPRGETDDETLFSVGVGVTGVVAAIAETGTLVCESQPCVARGSSLIPPVHLAVVALSQLLPDLCDYCEGLGQRAELPANVSLISGPSKTSDIEGVLVTGVHGPRELHVVLVRER
jgi:L-lactate utilization protein LutC